MKTISLSEEIENLDKKVPKLPQKSITPKNFNVDKKSITNLPQLRKVALARRRTKFVMIIALFISCFSLSVFIGFVGPFLLFK